MDWSNSTMRSAWIFHNSSSKTVSQISWVYLHFIPLHPKSGGQKAASILHPFFPPLAKWTKNRRLYHNSLWIFDPPLSSPFGVGWMGDPWPWQWQDPSPCSFGLVWLPSHDWKYCWLIWCERKILSVAEKVRLISQTSPSEQGVKHVPSLQCLGNAIWTRV